MTALTNAIANLVRSLDSVKGRRKAGLFVVEGTKCVLDTLGAFDLQYLIATPQWLEQYFSGQRSAVSGQRTAAYDIICANRGELARLSSLSLTSDVIAVYKLPPSPRPSPLAPLLLALDRIQDPGNLGTIIRTADWFGIHTILASKDTVDCFNPKTIQATMGAIARVNVIYGDLHVLLANSHLPVYGTFLDGDNIFTASLPERAVILLGNEGAGISDALSDLITHRLLIPSAPSNGSESLNVAAAAAITISCFSSQRYGKN